MKHWIVPVLVGLGFASFLGYSGIPALRHDWGSWIPNGAFFSNSWASISGWRTEGFGSPRPYPTDYLLVLLNACIVRLVGTHAGYYIDVFLIGFTVSAGGARLARTRTPSDAAAIAAALFATFNPWVYNEVVAGHIYMVLAYGATLLLASEMAQSQPSSFRLGAFLLLTMGQLQFFLPALLATAIWTLLRPWRPWPLLTAVVAFLPVWVGLASEGGYLRAIPYALAWQENQSVDPVNALVLSGYFALYADALPWYVFSAMWGVVAVAVIGSFVALVRAPRPAMWALIGVFGAWALASGTRGILGNAYVWFVSNVPASGLYRELYDVVAFVALAYLVACAVASQRVAALGWVWLAFGSALAIGWIVVPPARYWVPAHMLARVTIDAAPNTRYALTPALQPIRYLWGSGLDPDAVVLRDNVTPLNTQEFSYPESPALMRYEIDGDVRELEALSVARVADRPQYRSDIGKLGDQLAIPPPDSRRPLPPSATLEPLPELSLAPLPGLSEFPAPLWENGIFFGDVRNVRGPGVPPSWRQAPAVRVVSPNSSSVSAADGWVDARSAFVALPNLSQGLGGTITTNPHAALRIDPSAWTLAYVKGALTGGQGRGVAGDGQRYEWLRPFGVSSVYCYGLCVVVAQAGHPFHTAPSEARTGCSGGVNLSLPLSWLAVSRLPASSQCLLRYNVRFDPHWIAFAGGRRLAHVPIDSIANGWIVPAHAGAEPLIVVEGIAGIQFFLEVVAVAILLGIVVQHGFRTWRARES